MAERPRWLDDAFEEGRQARLDGKPQDACPLSDYPVRRARKAWADGWRSAVVTVREPQVTVREPQVTTPGTFWPSGQPLPDSYLKPQLLPCVGCRRVRLADGAQAVVVTTTSGALAYLWCRGCKLRFKLPIK